MTPAEVYTSVRRCQPSAIRATESVSFPTLKSIRATTELATAETNMTATPQPTVATGHGDKSLLTLSQMIHPAAIKISNASTVPEMFSIFPWPKGCFPSAGRLEVFTEKRAMMAATRSTPEWIASEMTETDPITTPTMSFMTTSVVLERTERSATLSLRSCASIGLTISLFTVHEPFRGRFMA